MSRFGAFHRPLYEGAARIRFTHEACCTRMQIFSRHSDGRHSFYIVRYRFIDWLEHGSSQYLEMDCNNLLRATEQHGIVTMQFHWISESYGGQLHGYTQSLSMPRAYLLEMMQTARNDAFFTYTGKYDGRVRFDFSNAERTLKRICADPLKRRALSKALRSRIDCRYGEAVRSYNDFADSFYLIHETSDGSEYNGGLVLHHGERNGRPYVYFGFHT